MPAFFLLPEGKFDFSLTREYRFTYFCQQPPLRPARVCLVEVVLDFCHQSLLTIYLHLTHRYPFPSVPHPPLSCQSRVCVVIGESSCCPPLNRWVNHLIIISLPLRPPTTEGQDSQDLGRTYRATHSSVRSFTRTARS